MNFVAPSPVDFHECGGLLRLVRVAGVNETDYWLTECESCGALVYLDDSWQVVPVERWAD